MTTYAYYAGCALNSAFSRFDAANRLVAEKVGYRLVPLEEWSCCGALSLPTANHLLSLALPLRNLAAAEEKGLDLVVACGTCLAALRRSRSAYTNRKAWRSAIREVLLRAGRPYTGRAGVYHLVELFTASQAMGRFRRRLKSFFRGMRVMVYYGCQLKECHLDAFFLAAGATVLPFEQKNRCCGSHAGPSVNASRAAYALLDEVAARQASYLAVSCPLCYLALTAAQGSFPGRYEVRVVYFSQFLAEAMGVST